MTNHERKLLAAISKWRRSPEANGGWKWVRVRSWAPYYELTGARMTVELPYWVDETASAVAGWCDYRDNGKGACITVSIGGSRKRVFDVASVTEAVDILAAVSILPPRFSSMYAAGTIDSRTEGYLEGYAYGRQVARDAWSACK